MRSSNPPETIVSIDIVRDHIEKTIFQLRPSHYHKQYPIWPGMVGIELEMLITDFTTLSGSHNLPSSVPLTGSDRSLIPVLRQLAEREGWQSIYSNDQPPLITKFDLNHQDTLTFEPGGQLEFSSRPYPCLQDAVKRLRSVQNILEEDLNMQGWQIIQMGISPWHSPKDIGLQMDKPRYKAMDEYFNSIGPYGKRMMRQTCTIQTCLDFGDSETKMAKRYLASQLLSPFAAAIFAYSPFKDGKTAGIPGFRSKIWRHLDSSRTGLTGIDRLSTKPDKESCVSSYLDFVMNARVVFTGNDYKIPPRKVSFAEWLSEAPNASGLPKPTRQDMETHLSLLFPDVRPRGFLELRSMDCQARPWQIVPAAFTTGLLYDDQCLDQLLLRLLPLKDNMETFRNFAEEGLRQASVAAVAGDLIQLASEGFRRLPKCFRGEGSEKALQKFAEHFTLQGKTPADEIDDLMSQSGKNFLTPSLLKKTEETWFSMLNS
ncbi:MAG: hypothetical protein H6618_07795 [Deltaproteobacteria bacterium]|nr:hypothetical protein [Deltaproteobacteria bacterium]